ncbi:MAG TPA: class I SAM-dependent methyltransferase [Terriglobales bacterium]|jgi:ubiquinone/menaquinone biosynthesis C-methylase UbiE|nr:class I SAM-dependent methyltransferase [Terriglobales bacterium]
MSSAPNFIVETYSRLAHEYDEEANFRSCWGRATAKAMAGLAVPRDSAVVLDVGCGTGRALAQLAASAPAGAQLFGIDPAENMRARALERTRDFANVRVAEGSFERIPLDSASVDYLYSVFAFHWVTDLDAAVKEIARVLKPGGRMDLFFIGRNNGREFIRKTTPIFIKYMGPARLLESARLRKQLKKEDALDLFRPFFDPARLAVEESSHTYYDTLEGHWSWWVRIEGHFMLISEKRRQACDAEVREALQSLAEPEGIPYTIHQLHVSVR